MRSIALMLALFAVTGPAAAQEWKEYTYPNLSFTVAFPADPKIETATYEAAEGRSMKLRADLNNMHLIDDATGKVL